MSFEKMYRIVVFGAVFLFPDQLHSLIGKVFLASEVFCCLELNCKQNLRLTCVFFSMLV